MMSPIFGVILLVAVASTQEYATNSSVKYCTTDSECPQQYCCLLQGQRYAMPACIPYQQSGEQCRVNAETITTNLTYPDNRQIKVNNINYILCPCADGLSCNPRVGICN